MMDKISKIEFGKLNFQKISLTLNTLKLIAIVAMLIDHIAWAFVPNNSNLGIIMHTIGKITGPIMFYSAVEGYHHTKNLKKYMVRLLIFAIISYIPFILFRANGDLSNIGISSFFRFNVIFTILSGVIAIYVRRNVKNNIAKAILIFLLIGISVQSDWGSLGFLIIFTFDYYYGNFKNQAFVYSLIIFTETGLLGSLLRPIRTFFYEWIFVIDWEHMLYMVEIIGMFISLFLLSLYKGEKGISNKSSQMFFYIFYPAHLLVIVAISFTLSLF